MHASNYIRVIKKGEKEKSSGQIGLLALMCERVTFKSYPIARLLATPLTRIQL